MASFYNNYYRYYSPYRFPISHKPYSSLDKSLPKQDLVNSTASLPSTDCPDKNQSSKRFEQEKISSSYSSFGPLRFKNPLFNDIEEPVFEVFGIELYLDDIIILGLLFFLYQEGVQDELLFLALFLLLVA